MQTIMWLRKLRKNKRGVSTVVTVVLSLVIVVVIVANVVLWSYNMNQYDLERMQENLSLAVVTRSSWFTVQSEYGINAGSRTGGSYLDTRADDSGYETFREGNPRRLDVNGTFIINLATYPLVYIQGIEILIKFQASDTGEAWYLKAYNWSSNSFSNSGFNYTAGFMPTTTTGWDYYKIGIPIKWADYVRSTDGKMFIQFHETIADGTQTTIRIDFLGVRAKTTLFSFRNNGPATSHVVALWVVNSTIHDRYKVDYYVNAGMNATFFNLAVSLPGGQYAVKVVTERGNIIVNS